MTNINLEEVPTAAILLIGNEILSGRTQDTNLSFIAKNLGDMGIDLLEVRVVPDDEAAIIEGVNALRKKYTYLFTTGGIGFTHDDITTACVAKAFNRPLEVNDEMMTILEKYYGDRFNEARRRMALVPEGVNLIENPVSGAPTYQIENVFVLAGMPSVMKGMFETLKPRLQRGPKVLSSSVKCYLTEGVLADELENIQNKYPSVSLGSYPFYLTPPEVGTVLVARGRNKVDVAKVTHELIELIRRLGGTPEVECQ